VEPESSREVFRGKLIRVDVERWPGGEREVVHHPGACAVVALTQRGEVVLVRQIREAVREALLEIPAGILDVEGEDPASCAARELLEETGFRAGELHQFRRPFGTGRSRMPRPCVASSWHGRCSKGTDGTSDGRNARIWPESCPVC
jgi:8-oxo-dGTP pyrophosphatase MutT (NUDIX family)